MRIIDIINSKQPTLSFEVFPPKNAEKMLSVERASFEMSCLRPDFMSVTYGAGGGTSDYTIEIASSIKNLFGVPALAHLTCVNSKKEKVREVLGEIREKGIENILALRGDILDPGAEARDYYYASELISEIRQTEPDICIGAACYPDGHVESVNKSEDIRHLKEKVDAGVDFLTTQMFFDNNVFYNFRYRLREAGINVPVIAGVMPITSIKQVDNVLKLSGTQVPDRFKALVDRFYDRPKAFEQAGIIYATEQIVDLISNYAQGIHIYSMNRPDIARKIRDNLSEILP